MLNKINPLTINKLLNINTNQWPTWPAVISSARCQPYPNSATPPATIELNTHSQFIHDPNVPVPAHGQCPPPPLLPPRPSSHYRLCSARSLFFRNLTSFSRLKRISLCVCCALWRTRCKFIRVRPPCHMISVCVHVASELVLMWALCVPEGPCSRSLGKGSWWQQGVCVVVLEGGNVEFKHTSCIFHRILLLNCAPTHTHTNTSINKINWGTTHTHTLRLFSFHHQNFNQNIPSRRLQLLPKSNFRFFLPVPSCCCFLYHFFYIISKQWYFICRCWRRLFLISRGGLSASVSLAVSDQPTSGLTLQSPAFLIKPLSEKFYSPNCIICEEAVASKTSVSDRCWGDQ